MNPNPIGLDGIEFAEFASPRQGDLEKLFLAFGFSKVMDHPEKAATLYEQNDIHFVVNRQPGSFADRFKTMHGPSLPSMGWRVKDARVAKAEAVKRGAKPCEEGDWKVPAIYGIGDSIIYFIEKPETIYKDLGFVPSPNPVRTAPKGFTFIDHLTNNVEKGTMNHWSDFYKNVFGFTEVRYFDIRGTQTGLLSYALRSPCGKFCIPINEGTEDKSQINEYLRDYKGPGVQHIALATEDILSSLRAMENAGVEMLDIDLDYYEEAFQRVPNVTEDKEEVKRLQVLVDGDDKGYLLQIFTRNIIGPIFFEVIQRKNNLSFGEGNFGALFRSIERDQQRRGTL